MDSPVTPPPQYQGQKTALVTGGAGFLGSNLVKRLLDRGYKVIAVDDLTSGRMANLEPFANNPDFTYIQHDIRGEKLDTERTLFLKNVITNGQKLRDIPFDEIYNLACPASPPFYQGKDQKNRTLQASVSGISNVLKLAKSVGKKTGKPVKVLQFSTSEVYGNPHISPQPEGYNGNVSLGPRACYDEGKRAAETYINDWVEQHGTEHVDARVIRIFNTYGPGMRPDDGRAVSNFVMQALEGKPITIYGDGKQTRSFCYVDDLLGGIERLMALKGDYAATLRNATAICLNPDEPKVEKRICKIVDQNGKVILPELHQVTFDMIRQNKVMPINLGNPVEFTINELVDKVIKVTGSTSTVTHKPIPVHDPMQRKPIITLAQYLLGGWRPKVQLEGYTNQSGEYIEGGLAKTIKHFKQEMAYIDTKQPSGTIVASQVTAAAHANAVLQPN